MMLDQRSSAFDLRHTLSRSADLSSQPVGVVRELAFSRLADLVGPA